MGTLGGLDAGTLHGWADQIGDVLLATEITADGRSTWLGVTVDRIAGEIQAVRRTGDVALYDGSAGIAWCGMACADLLGRSDLVELAVRAARHAVSGAPRLTNIGLYDGLAGVGLAALLVGERSEERKLSEAGCGLLDLVASVAPTSADLVSGSAGLIIALLTAGRVTGDRRWDEPAIGIGEHAVMMAERRTWGWYWPSPGGGLGLCGLAHGAAGVAWALGELRARAHADQFDEAVASALRFERSWFDTTLNNWPDLRSDGPARVEAPPRPALWCHGAAGIGLSRLALYRNYPQSALAAEAAAALQAASAAATQALEGGQLDHGLTLCHGLGGTVELLLTAHDVLGDREHLETARWLLARALELVGPDVELWPSGVPGGLVTPGMMTGLAGTLYLFVRAADPRRLSGIGLLGDQPSSVEG
jgi:lantibiotic modifying enzyme